MIFDSSDLRMRKNRLFRLFVVFVGDLLTLNMPDLKYQVSGHLKSLNCNCNSL